MCYREYVAAFFDPGACMVRSVFPLSVLLSKAKGAGLFTSPQAGFEADRFHRDRSGVTYTMVLLVRKSGQPPVGRRVVSAIFVATRRAGLAIFVELVLKRMTGVLADAIGMMHDVRSRAPAEPSYPAMPP